MADLIDLIIASSSSSDESILREKVAAHVAELVRSAHGGNKDHVYIAESAIERNAGSFAFDRDQYATLTVDNLTWRAGRLDLLSIGELKEQALQKRTEQADASIRLWVLDGESPATDIGSLQATSDKNTVFQVASQFNCLESKGPYVMPVTAYFSDSTQGPRASISAFPGALLRTYSAQGNDGTRFRQRSYEDQLHLLRDVYELELAQNGYFIGHDFPDHQSILSALENNFDKIRVGVHSDVQVVLGYDWDGSVENSDERRITQVFTSTAAGGGYGAERNFGHEGFLTACRQFLRAAYLGTLLAAINVDRTRVVLTLIGGGAFGNPVELIWDSIQWAIEQAKRYAHSDLDVILNGYNLGSQINLEKQIVPVVRKLCGSVLVFNDRGLSRVLR